MSSVEAEPVCAALEQIFLIFFLLCSELVLLYFSECVSVALFCRRKSWLCVLFSLCSSLVLSFFSSV